jgi:putative PIN family toxin of toxin-antitoxin system
VIGATFDINLLASGFIAISNPRSTPGELIRRWEQGEFELVVSQHISQGLARVLQKPYFAALVTSDELQRIDALLHQRAHFVVLTAQVRGVAPDQNDDLVLSTALSGQTEYLVTGDGKLRQLVRYQSVRILNPRQFLDLLQAQRTIS